jgi:Plavaka transposase
VSPAADARFDETRPIKRRRQLPSRFRVACLELHDKKLRDILPEAVPPLPPPGVDDAALAPSPILRHPLPYEQQPIPSTSRLLQRHGPRLRRVLETAQNYFGLFRRYVAEKFPTHDPEAEVNTSTLSNIVEGSNTTHSSSDVTQSFGPFPNKSSFRLGDWYWNHGVRKSKEDFKELVNIIGADDFQPAEVRAMQWDKINAQLAINDWDKGEWVDEDAGWTSVPVTISVPFHRFTDNPGIKDYAVSDFHYRPLVSVIKEKLAKQSDHPHFHYEPYELLWRPPGNGNEVRVHGELYTSPAFIDAHNELQNSPCETGCDLPRVIVALMFWSDATHLTTFGNTTLWPLYMFFGNESKYRRCKPSCNLCEHVAYFEKVSVPRYAVPRHCGMDDRVVARFI